MKRIFVLLCCLCLMPVVAQAREVIDLVGRKVEVPDNPRRIISLAPSITEILFSLGQQKKLKGVTLYSDYPPAAQEIPKVGSYIHLDVERIAALKPDLCFAIKDGNPRHVVEKIEALGIPVFVVDPRNMEEIITTTARMGDVLNARREASELVSDMKGRLERVKATIAKASSRPAVFFQVDASPVVSAGEGTFTDELITLAGGRNLAAGTTSYPRYNWEDILSLQPEIVIVASMAGGFTDEKLKSEWQQWPQLPAVRNGRLYVVKADMFDRPTVRLFRGLEILAKIIHPELYGKDGDK